MCAACGAFFSFPAWPLRDDGIAPPTATSLLRHGPPRLRDQCRHATLLPGSLTWEANQPETNVVVPVVG
ncbi:hypothetical protein JCM12296A_07760 [Desulfosarcina cetonica]